MALAPVPRKENGSPVEPGFAPADSVDWVRIAASSALIAGGLLYLAGQRRAGMLAAATGTALAMLDQQELLRSWLKLLPGYIDQVEHLIDDVQSVVEEVDAKRRSLRQVLSKAANEG